MRNRASRAGGDFQETRFANIAGWGGRVGMVNMVKQLQYRRLAVLALLLGVAFAGLAYRLVDLQVLRFQEFSAKARRNTLREFLLEPRRGDILDAKGNLLATSAFVKTVCADPALIGNRQAEVARAVAPLLQVSEGELFQRLTPRLVRNTDGAVTTNHYVVLKRKVQVETWQKIQSAMTNLSFGLDEKKLPKHEREFYRDLRRGSIYVEKLDDQAMLVWPLVRRGAGGPSVNTLEATQLINRQDALVLDVREQAEFAASHILNSRGLPLSQIEARIGDIEKFKDKPVIVYCATGNRSSAAAAGMRQRGFSSVFNLSGGFAAWQQAGLPVQK